MASSFGEASPPSAEPGALLALPEEVLLGMHVVSRVEGEAADAGVEVGGRKLT